MGATSTQSTSSLLAKLRRQFPQLQFKRGRDFSWNPQEDIIYYIPSGDISLLLHEVGHAILAHTDYKHDIELLEMERDAWTEADRIAKLFNLKVDQDTRDSNLDTYRHWLHQRSTCPICNLNGLQVDHDTYQCINCHSKWSVNEARTCGLKRKLITK